jgi:large subunit ribosomal protein L51
MNTVKKSIEYLRITPKEFSVPVRDSHYYFKDRKPLVRRYGYEDKLAWRGALPRLNTGLRVPKPDYNPSNVWTEKKALFGQNDYIDILGNPKLHPVLISYDVPPWLRGFHGNEYQMLIRKRNFYGRRISAMNPDGYGKMWRRIRHQYKFLNWSLPQNKIPKGHLRMIQNK